jgi:hypothetical protein
MLLVILIIVYINKNSQINQKEQELSIIIKEKEKIMNDFDLTKNIIELNEKNALIKAQIDSENKFIENNNTYFNNLLEQIKQAKSELSELKESKKNIENSEKIKLQKIIDEKKNLTINIYKRLLDLSIDNSNIEIDIINFRKITKSEILNRCYDSIVYGFNPEKYHDNCDGWPILILIKTKKGENIGAYITKSIEGEENIEDDNSMLINFDTFTFYSFKKDLAPVKYPIYCSQKNFTRFANDLIIYNNGKGESSFPDCYGINEGEEGDLFKEQNFDIDIIEVYKLNIDSS